MDRAAAEGRLADAAWIAFEDFALANDEELAILAAAGAAEFVAPNVPVHLREIEPFLSYRFLADPRLERLTMPTVLLRGSRTHTFFTNVVRHLAGRLPDAHVREIGGAGHMGPLLAPQPAADELVRFFTRPVVPASISEGPRRT